MKKIWQEFKSFIKMISKGKKDVAVVMAAGGFMKASIPFLVFYFSAQILNNAIEGDYEACVKSVAALLLSQFVCELVNRFCQKRIEVLGESCQQIIRQQMADKAFELQYEKFEKQEKVILLCLNSRLEIIQEKLLFIGSGDASMLETKEVFQHTLRCGANRIILIHNHPSGNPEPSTEDIEFTETLDKASKILGIELLDHVVVAGYKFFSVMTLIRER